MRAVLATTLALACLAQAVAAEAPQGTARLTFAGPDHIDVDLDGALSGATAAQMRSNMDVDRDGAVSPAESDAFAAKAIQSLQGRPVGATAARLLLDGHEQNATTVVALRYDGATKAASDTSPIGIHWQVRLTFRVAPGSDRHVLVVDPGNFSRAGHVPFDASQARFEALAPWRLNMTSDAPDGAVADPSGHAVDLPLGLDPSVGTLRFDLRLAPEDATTSQEAPAPVFGLASLALAWAARRVPRARRPARPALRSPPSAEAAGRPASPGP